MSRIIDADKLSADMYHEAFEKDSDMQKWDSGCWIRYKMFENVLKAQPTVEAPDINVGNIDTTTHDSIPAETGKNDSDRTTYDYISRQKAIDALRKMQTYKLFAGDDMLLIDQAEAQTELMMLPPVQSEHCKDAVSREAALSMIDTYMNKSVELHYLPTSDGIEKLISILPSVRPEPRTAYWTKDIVGSVICSNCGGIREDNRIGHTQWCNCCGCFMRGE